MSTPTPSPGRLSRNSGPARTNATKQKLFEASMVLIGERGAAGVTVDEIAAAAGVSKGTVYYNFGSKSDLIAQLLRHGVEILETRLAKAEGGLDAVRTWNACWARCWISSPNTLRSPSCWSARCGARPANGARH